MNDARPAADEPGDRELDDLVVRHLDGGLDPAGQRRLADLLAASADARATFARYLRLEGAALRLGAGRLLNAGAETAGTTDQPCPLPGAPTPSRPAGRADDGIRADTGRAPQPRRRTAFIAIAASLLAAVVLSQVVRMRIGAGPAPDMAALDDVADGWLTVSRDAATAASHQPDALTGPDADDGRDDTTDEPLAGSTAPPGWLVAALADEAAQPVAPDEG